jgi:hypothetical protein
MTEEELAGRLAVLETLTIATAEVCLAACFKDPAKLAEAINAISVAMLSRADEMAIRAGTLSADPAIGGTLEGAAGHAATYAMHLSRQLDAKLNDRLTRRAAAFMMQPVEGSA